MESGLSVLQVAITEQMTEVALAILAHPEYDQVNARDVMGSTALHQAILMNSMDSDGAVPGHPGQERLPRDLR